MSRFYAAGSESDSGSSSSDDEQEEQRVTKTSAASRLIIICLFTGLILWRDITIAKHQQMEVLSVILYMLFCIVKLTFVECVKYGSLHSLQELSAMER